MNKDTVIGFSIDLNIGFKNLSITDKEKYDIIIKSKKEIEKFLDRKSKKSNIVFVNGNSDIIKLENDKGLKIVEKKGDK